MEDKVIVYHTVEGDLHIVIPSPFAWEEFEKKGMSFDIFMKDEVAKAVPSGVVYEIIDRSLIPSDRTFRDAWKWNSAKQCVEHDFEKCKKIRAKQIHDEKRAQEAKKIDNAILDKIDSITDIEALKNLKYSSI
jgi:hypothetical protein